MAKGYRGKRMAAAVAVTGLATVGYVTGFGLGTPSAWGIGWLSLPCPLGGIEALLASKFFVPSALASLVVVVALSLLLGRTWCAWACPAQIVRGVLGCKEVRAEQPSHVESAIGSFKLDSRLWVLAGVLIAALVVGFPVFCLICPIGLVFGTVFSLVQLVMVDAFDWCLLAFPAALVIELAAMRKWCLRICPIAGLLALFGHFAKLFRPQVDESTCLRACGGDCRECLEACPEGIDLHADSAALQLADCTRCAECKGACPTSSITMPFLAGRDERRGAG